MHTLSEKVLQNDDISSAKWFLENCKFQEKGL